MDDQIVIDGPVIPGISSVYSAPMGNLIYSISLANGLLITSPAEFQRVVGQLNGRDQFTRDPSITPTASEFSQT